MGLFRTQRSAPAGALFVSLSLAAVLALGPPGCALQPPGLNEIFLRPTGEIIVTPGDMGYRYDELFVPINEERRISIWHVHADNPKALVVIIPGSDKNKSRYLVGLPVFIPRGYDVILMDYEGFGQSPGENTLENLLDDGLAAVDYALSQNQHVIAFGLSTGASVAVRVATQRELTGVLLEASLILKHEPELYLRYLGIEAPALWRIANVYTYPMIPDGFDILKWIRQVEEPKFIMQSVEDDVTTYEAGLRVFAAAAEPTTFWATRGEHGDMIELEPELYAQMVTGWADSLLPAAGVTGE